KYVLDRSDKYSNIIFISIHNNSTGATSQTSASGIRVYYRPTMKVKDESGKSVVYYDGYNDDGRKLFAQILNEEMQKKSVFSKKTNKLYNDSDLAVLREQNVVSALVEVGFINNPNDLALLRRQQTREDIAAGMFEGIRKYFAQIKNKVENLLGA
ncbi:MAG TPA: N-acetylmuramoyl-L-alanine amidase, partial [Tepidimicrobium sp.]|nr:N-acetylmuramoyl-L-alanine amidase [Tepidimicrobium sp.]